MSFFINDTATTEIYTLSLHDALPIYEADVKKLLGVQHWVRDLSYRDALERLASQPTVNIEGMYAGYTGPRGKNILPSYIDRKSTRLNSSHTVVSYAGLCLSKTKLLTA